jgi:hypothetical protein
MPFGCAFGFGFSFDLEMGFAMTGRGWGVATSKAQTRSQIKNKIAPNCTKRHVFSVRSPDSKSGSLKECRFEPDRR